MASDDGQDEANRDWAIFVAHSLGTRRWHGVGVATSLRLQEQVGVELLRSIDAMMERDPDFHFPPFWQSYPRKIAVDAGQILASIDSLPAYSIPTLTGLDTRLGFNPVINVADRYTVKSMGLDDPDRLVAETGDSRYSPEAADEHPRIEMVSAEEATTGFIATLAAALRGWRTQRPSPRNSGGTIDYTVHSDLADYVLDCWPEYAVTRSRFGHVATSPVTDRLYSGHYFFEGRKGKRIETDPTRHLVASERTQTRLCW